VLLQQWVSTNPFRSVETTTIFSHKYCHACPSPNFFLGGRLAACFQSCLARYVWWTRAGRVRGRLVFALYQRTPNPIVLSRACLEKQTQIDVLEIQPGGGTTIQWIKCHRVLLATGSQPFKPPGIPFDGKRIFDSDSINTLAYLPRLPVRALLLWNLPRSFAILEPM
jgi:hypothetical protein